MSNFVLKELNCVFIHIPKTGGLSIRKGVFKESPQKRFFGKIPNQYQDYLKFAFVRNPFDRLVSCWKYTSLKRLTRWQSQRDRSGTAFSEFLEIATDDSIPYNRCEYSWKSFLRHHAIPMTHPFNCLHLADVIGHFENLQEDFNTICDTLKVPRQQLPHKNKSKHKHYTEYYNDETRSIVTEKYAKDIEYFGYGFGE